MKKKQLLFSLIKSLSKGEKIHFRKNASIYKGKDKNNYLKLFNLIDGMDEYDEAVLKEKLKGDPMEKYLAESKYYLHQLILKSLNNFYSGFSVNSQLRQIIESIEIMYERGLFEEVEFLIDKGERLAKKYERQYQLIEIYKWKKRLILDRLKMEKSQKHILVIQEKVRQIINTIQSVFEVDAVRDDFVLYINKQFKYLSEEELNKVKEIFNRHAGEMKKLEEQALPFIARRSLYDVYYFYYCLINNNPEALKWSEKLVNLVEENEELAAEDPHVYAVVLHNHMSILLNNKRCRESLLLSERLREVIKSYFTSSWKAERFNLLSHHADLCNYINLGRFEEAGESVKNIESRLRDFAGKLSRFMLTNIYYNLSFYYFHTADYAKATKAINLLLGDTELEGNVEYMLRFGQLLSLMLYYEKGNTELLEYRCKSVLRYLKKQHAIYAFEKVFIDYMSKLSKAADNEKPKLFKEMKKHIQKNPREWEMIDESEIGTWINSKINRTTFKEEYQKKLKANDA